MKNAASLSCILLLTAVLSGCAWVGVPPDLVGDWGGEHVRLTVSPEGARIEFDCAHGSLDEPLVPDSDGNFAQVGVYVREHGGPMREGEEPDAHPARYYGQVRGTRMRLEVELLDSDQKIGPFLLGRGEQPRVYKCL